MNKIMRELHNIIEYYQNIGCGNKKCSHRVNFKLKIIFIKNNYKKINKQIRVIFVI